MPLMLVASAALAMAAPPETAAITEADTGTTVSLVVGEMLTVTLQAQPGTGYRWEPAADSTSLLSLMGATLEGAAIPGAAQTQRLTFVARSVGAGDLRLVYRRPWEKNGVAQKRFSVAVRIGSRSKS